MQVTSLLFLALALVANGQSPSGGHGHRRDPSAKQQQPSDSNGGGGARLKRHQGLYQGHRQQHAPRGSTSTAYATTARGCINTPDEYKRAFDRRERRCVSPHLYVCSPYDPTFSNQPGDTLYHKGFDKAWIGSSTNLEFILQLQHAYGSDPVKVVLGVAWDAGFGVNPGFAEDGEVSLGFGNGLLVFTLSPRLALELEVPTIASWVKFWEDEYGLTYPFPTERELFLDYSSVNIAHGESVADVYSEITGCELERCPETRANGANGAAVYTATCPGPQFDGLPIGGAVFETCGQAATEAAVSLGGAPDGGNPAHPDKVITAQQCVNNFQKNYNPAKRDGPANRAALRVAIQYCANAFPLFTSNGLGWDSSPNPFVCKPAARQSVRDRYSGREFVIPNVPIENFPQRALVRLSSGPGANYDFLAEGYC